LLPRAQLIRKGLSDFGVVDKALKIKGFSGFGKIVCTAKHDSLHGVGF
jgi:hypothetical protein